MLISLGNVNQMVGVRDATSIRSGIMVNSTDDFCTLIFGMQPVKRFIPHQWMRNAGRVELTPRALEPNLQAFEVIRAHKIRRLDIAERTGCFVFFNLWS